MLNALVQSGLLAVVGCGDVASPWPAAASPGRKRAGGGAPCLLIPPRGVEVAQGAQKWRPGSAWRALGEGEEHLKCLS
ncbi:MAG: hypothetical protein RL385_6145, partial [Pseudomonadota bacterium]